MFFRELIDRIVWMFKVRDCSHCCVFCEYYEFCKIEGTRRRKKK